MPAGARTEATRQTPCSPVSETSLTRCSLPTHCIYHPTAPCGTTTLHHVATTYHPGYTTPGHPGVPVYRRAPRWSRPGPPRAGSEVAKHRAARPVLLVLARTNALVRASTSSRMTRGIDYLENLPKETCSLGKFSCL